MAKKKIIKRNKASPRRPETIAPRRAKTKAKRAPLMTNAELTHIDPRGQARMVDVSAKNMTERLAIAEGHVGMREETLALVLAGDAKKGDAQHVALLGVAGEY